MFNLINLLRAFGYQEHSRDDYSIWSTAIGEDVWSIYIYQDGDISIVQLSGMVHIRRMKEDQVINHVLRLGRSRME